MVTTTTPTAMTTTMTTTTTAMTMMTTTTPYEDIWGIVFVYIKNNWQKGWALPFLMRGFGLSKTLSIEVGFAFSNKGLKSQDLRLRMFNDFRFGLGKCTTHLTYIRLNVVSTWKITLTELPLHNANSVIVLFSSMWKGHLRQCMSNVW